MQSRCSVTQTMEPLIAAMLFGYAVKASRDSNRGIQLSDDAIGNSDSGSRECNIDIGYSKHGSRISIGAIPQPRSLYSEMRPRHSLLRRRIPGLRS